MMGVPDTRNSKKKKKKRYIKMLENNNAPKLPRSDDNNIKYCGGLNGNVPLGLPEI